MNPTARTIQILLAVEKKGSAYFQTDDGAIDFRMIQQLTEIAGNVGYDLIRFDSYRAAKLMDPEKTGGSGCYILFHTPDINAD